MKDRTPDEMPTQARGRGGDVPHAATEPRAADPAAGGEAGGEAGAATAPEPAPAPPRGVDRETALAAQRAHELTLLDIPGVVGVAVGSRCGQHALVVMVAPRPGVDLPIPASLDGVPIQVRVVGPIVAKASQ